MAFHLKMNKIKNFSRICRVCLKTKDGHLLVPLTLKFQKVSVVSLIKSCSSIEISPAKNLHLPQKVCNECLTQLKIARMIRLKCLQSHKALMKLNADQQDKSNSSFIDIMQEEMDPADVIQVESSDEDDYVANCDDNEVDSELELFKPLSEKAAEKIKTNKLKIVASRVNLSLLRKIPPKNAPKLEEDGVEEGISTCQYCSKQFSKKILLKIHKQSKFCALNQSKCQFCPRLFKHRHDFLNHFKRCQGNPNNEVKPVTTFICEYCGKVLTKNRGLQRHLVARHKMNLTERPTMFPCTHCEKTFQFKYSLKIHENTRHLNVRNFHCHHCPKRYVENSALQWHLKMHEDPSVYNKRRAYVCAICPARFKKEFSLANHSEIHDLASPARPFHCLVCVKGFKSKPVLNKHIRSQHQPPEEEIQAESAHSSIDMN